MEIKDELVKILSDLIRFKTVHSRMDEIERCSLYIENFLKINNIPYEKIVNDGYPSILVTPNKRSADIILMSHMDVVDGEESMFVPKLEGDVLYGRGSIDDKYAVAISLLLCRKFYSDEAGRNRIPFGILITSDEEIGGNSGAGKIIKDLHSDFFIILDGGNPGKIVVKEKGLIKIKITSKGKSAHGSRPWLGDNAIENLYADFMKVKELFTEVKDDNWNKTINFGIVNGGKSHNQVPKEAVGIFDVRYTEKDDPDELIDSIRSVIKGELEVESTGPVFTCADNTYLDYLLKLSNAEKGTEHGASDARYVSASGRNGIVWGAEGNKSQHSENEHVLVSGILTLHGYLESLIQYYMKKPN